MCVCVCVWHYLYWWQNPFGNLFLLQMHRLADSSMVKMNSDTNKTNDPDTNKTDEDLESHETGSFKPD